MTNLINAAGAFGTIWSVVQAMLVLLFMVTIHEFGHYIAGKKLGFKINEFSVGFGPAIFKKKVKSGEYFSLRVIPLGGYCAFEGEEAGTDSPQSFEKQKPWKRIIVLVAGAFMNFFITVLIVILTFSISGQYLYSVNTVLPTTEGATLSQEVEIQKDDVILSINGKKIYLGNELSKALVLAKEKGEDSVDLVVLRNGEKVEITTPLRQYDYEVEVDGVKKTQSNFGIGMLQGSELVKFNIFETVGRSFTYCFKMGGEILSFMGQLFTGKIGLDSMSGPVGTIQITAQIANQGFRALLEIIALIGVNLAVFNLLPIPALDGSKVVFTAIEWVRGKPINQNVETMIHFIGMIAIFGFAIMVDLLKWL